MKKVRLGVLLAVVALLLASLGAAAPACETCATLNYQCIQPGNPLALKNACGELLDAALCPVASCGDYCSVMTTVPSTGRCNDVTHQCECLPTDPVPLATPSPTSGGGAKTTSGCTPLTCTLLREALRCIPRDTKDACTGEIIPQDACGMPLCAAGCACTSDGRACNCTSSSSATRSPSKKAPSARAAEIASPSASTYIVANTSTIYVSLGTIIGMSVGSAIGLLGIGVIVAAVVKKCNHDGAAGFNYGAPFYSKRAGGVVY